MRVGVIGTGRVGLVVGACLSNQGHAVVCHDRDEGKIARLEAGRTPFFEPQLDQLVAQGMATGCLRFSGRMEDAVGEAEVVFICVGTPLDGQGSLDLSAVAEVADQIAELIQGYTVVILKSTVPVGTAGMVKQTIRG